LPEQVPQREHGAGQAAVGDQLERGGGGRVTGGPHPAERFQDGASAGEDGLVGSGQDPQGPAGGGWYGSEHRGVHV
jgi:hypothetical protein